MSCEGCDGSGMLCPASPACGVGVPPGWTPIERCDECKRFESDLAAANASTEAWNDIMVVKCQNNCLHILVQPWPKPGAAHQKETGQ